MAAFITLAQTLTSINEDMVSQYVMMKNTVLDLSDRLGDFSKPLLDLLECHRQNLLKNSDGIEELAAKAQQEANKISSILSIELVENKNSKKSKAINSAKIQSYLEKSAAFITAVESVIDPINNSVEAIIVNQDQQILQPSISTSAYEYSEQSINDYLASGGYVVAGIISGVGSDEDAALKSPEEIKEEIDDSIKGDALMKSNLSKNTSLVVDSLVAFSGTVLENNQYGEGGAHQVFIPNASFHKDSGVLAKVKEIYEGDDGKVFVGDIPLEDVTLMENDDNTTTYLDDIDYLDKNTIDTEGLNMVVDSNGKPVNQSIESKLHPHSDQEDTNGSYYPDSWKKSSLKKGALLFQLSVDGNTGSSYFTDSFTINSCMRNGVLDFNQLRNKLQLANGLDKKCLTVYRYDI